MTQLIESADPQNDTIWIFKSYKQLAKLSYRQQKYPEVLGYIGKIIAMLTQLNGNYAEESVNKLLARYSASSNSSFVNEMFDIIVSHLENCDNSGMSGQRLWLKININRLNNFVESGNWAQCHLLIRAINSRLDDVSELTRNSYGLEVIAAEIAFVMKQGGDLSRLSQLYRRSKEVNAAITHPRVMGVIRECGATIHFYRKNYDEARVEFYECFKSYDEAGSSAKKTILKYLSLCSLLTENEVNPFESQETQTYSLLPEYQNLIELVNCYERQDLAGYVAVVKKMDETGDELASDKIFHHSQKQILHNLKVKLFANVLESYSAIRYDTVIRKLQLSGNTELEDLIISMANSGVGANVRLNFTDRIIEVPSDPETSVFPATLDAHAVLTNRNIVDLMRFQGVFGEVGEQEEESMHIDNSPQLLATAPADDNLQVPQSEEAPKKSSTRTLRVKNTIAGEEEWLNYMRSAIPSKSHHIVSQKEQIFTEQQEGSKLAAQADKDAPENDAPEETNPGGILGSSLDYANQMEEDDEEEAPAKLDLLERWSLVLFNEIYHPKATTSEKATKLYPTILGEGNNS